MLNIRDLSKEIDMTAVRGGTSLVGQVVPTNLQSNELLQKFNVVSTGPVAIANDATQSNDAEMTSFAPVGSILGALPYGFWY
jgi:hypothetical protein